MALMLKSRRARSSFEPAGLHQRVLRRHGIALQAGGARSISSGPRQLQLISTVRRPVFPEASARPARAACPRPAPAAGRPAGHNLQHRESPLAAIHHQVRSVTPRQGVAVHVCSSRSRTAPPTSARRSPAAARCSSGQREAGMRESPRRRADQWAVSASSRSRVRPPFTSRHNGPAGTRTRLRRPDQPGAVLQQPRPGRESATRQLSVPESAPWRGIRSGENDAPPPRKRWHKPDHSQPAPSPARCSAAASARMRRLRLIKSVWAWHVPAVSSSSQPTSGLDGDGAQQPGAAAVKQRIGSGLKLRLDLARPRS